MESVFRTWARENRLKRSDLDALLDRDRRDLTPALKKLFRDEERVSKEIESEEYAVASFKSKKKHLSDVLKTCITAFSKAHGLRQPAFLQRIKTPSKESLIHAR